MGKCANMNNTLWMKYELFPKDSNNSLTSTEKEDHKAWNGPLSFSKGEQHGQDWMHCYHGEEVKYWMHALVC